MIFGQRNNPFPSTEEQNNLGAVLEPLCTNETFLAQGIFKVFKLSTSSSPLLRSLTPLPEVAVKQVFPSSEFDYVTHEWRDVMQREWNAQLTMRHENVVRLLALGSTADCK